MKRSDVTADVGLYLKVERPGSRLFGLGRGVVSLCELVEREGSLNRAAKVMGMAYSKAWRITKESEESLGFPLFVRMGAQGSRLTPEARALIDGYRSIERKLMDAADQALDEMFESLDATGLFFGEPATSLPLSASPELIEEVKMLDFHRKGYGSVDPE